MLIVVVAYLGGVLTILSPCILPVLPFVFARSDQPFRRSGLPILIGMAATFAAVASLAAVGGGWVLRANQYGRVAALLLMAFFGLALLLPQLTEHLTRPLVALGARLSHTPQGAPREATIGSSLLLGVATGLLWAPCAGPILGLLLTGAALNGASLRTSLLLLAYAAGAATSLAAALLVGGKLFAAMKRSLGAGEWIRRGLGVAILAGVAIVAFGLDTGLLTQVSLADTNGVEQSLINRLGVAPQPAAVKVAAPAAEQLPIEGTMPSLAGATAWLDSPPLTAQSLRGHVVLIDFWTYSCINCLRTLPYVEAWASKYHDQGLVVIGVHTPEFAFERNVDNIRAALKRLGITYPVAVDSNYAIWRGFNNEYWPADYFIDAQGRIRGHQFGEGDYAGSEHIIQDLLREAGDKTVPTSIVAVDGHGVERAADLQDVESPETYIGTDRAEHFASPGGEILGQAHDYTAPATLSLNQWALAGTWQVAPQDAVSHLPDASISFRFHARDLHLVLGPAADGKPVRFQVTIDGQPPGADHGSDTDAAGNGTITSQRLYQLVRLSGEVKDHTFAIRFTDPGATAYSFTFG